jgi:hypothetical protein
MVTFFFLPAMVQLTDVWIIDTVLCLHLSSFLSNVVCVCGIVSLFLINFVYSRLVSAIIGHWGTQNLKEFI